MKKVVAFADEFGNNSFKFSTESSHFIIASVIVNKEELPSFYDSVESIRGRYFQKGEIKSSKIKDNHTRRLKILEEICQLNFSVYAVVVDKTKLYGEGFKYKKSFYKYLNGILYKELYKTFPKLELFVDEHGGNEFMAEFKKYVADNHIRDLFQGAEFYIKDSDTELGVQVADLMAGTLGYIYDEHKKNDKSADFLTLLENRLISINHFPKKYSSAEYLEENSEDEYNKIITELSLNNIFSYLDTESAENQQKQDSINFLKLLIRYHEASHYKNYTTAAEFIHHLNVNRDAKLGKEQFGSLVGNLRDKGILIASSRDGYKVPTSHEDIKKYIRHGNSIVMPLLRRIELCRRALLLATNNDFDVLEENEFSTLAELTKKINI